MKAPNKERMKVLSFKITPKVEEILNALQLQLGMKAGKAPTMTDVVEAAIICLAKKEKIDTK